MKKSVILKIVSILLVELVYLFSYHYVFGFLGVNAWIKGLGQFKLAGQIFTEEIPIILLLFLLNHFFWKQKILFAKYPFFKGLGVSFYTIFAFLMAVIFTFVKHHSFSYFAVMFVATIFIGIAEDLAFRGLIFGTLVSKGKSLSFAIIVSSALFASLHGINIFHQPLLNTVLQVIYVFPMGIALAAVYVKTNNIIYPILLHGMQDFMAAMMSGGTASTVTSILAVLQTYIVYLTVAFVVLYADTQQMQNFVSRLRGLTLEKVQVRLPRLALNDKFRLKFTIVTLIYGIAAYIVMQGVNLALGLQAARTSPSFSSIAETSARTTQSYPMLSQLTSITVYSGLALYIFLITFFHFKRRHLFWLLIPVVGGPIFAIVALAGGFKPVKIDDTSLKKVAENR